MFYLSPVSLTLINNFLFCLFPAMQHVVIFFNKIICFQSFEHMKLKMQGKSGKVFSKVCSSLLGL